MPLVPYETYEKHRRLFPVTMVDLIILYNHHVLFVRRAEEPMKGHWFLPGGRLWHGETFEECAIRKARDECGLIDLLPLIMVNYEAVMYGDLHSLCHCYVMLSNRDKVTLDETSTDYVWVYYKDIQDEHIANGYVRRCLEGANLL